jgi:hypothetical protein
MLLSIFKVWQARLHQALSISSFRKRSDEKTKAYVWSLWYLLAGQSQSAKTVRDLRVKKLLYAALNKWRKAFRNSVEELRKREASAAAFWNQKCMYTTWFEWISYMRSCKERLKCLQDCIALIESRRSFNLLRELVHIWDDYTSER